MYGSVRMDAVNDENLAHYYRLLKVKACLKENDLLTHPEQIYNMDETGVPLDPKPLNSDEDNRASDANKSQFSTAQVSVFTRRFGGRV